MGYLPFENSGIRDLAFDFFNKISMLIYRKDLRNKKSMDKDNYFRLPRKIKKKLKKTIWLYPADKNGNSLMAWPTHSQKDYDAIKQGIVRDIMADSTKEKRKQEKKILDKPTEVSDKTLKAFIDEIFAKEYRNFAFRTLVEAKKTPRAKVAYYNFINAFRMVENEKDSFRNICCMSVDLARDLLKKKRMNKK